MANEILREIFRQNFENMRHAERERTGFMQFYALIIAAVFGFMAYVNFTDVRPLWGVLTGLSGFGFLVSRRWSANISCDCNKAEECGNKIPEDLRGLISFGDKRGLTNRKLFPWMYALVILIFFALTIFNPSGS